ncbi:DUF6471 domain-containing protein [Comamonas thiooxydans]|uniref:DUF6471 domain-containing protein n=1 Tax=Comamonas thiooxydans TaxID=363952 RepID=UPI00209C4BE4|nr:DUF6471 domain-containing protein [Comamonas thiooxydans]MCO8252139.1 DUF6471 domain-containing protein [Comamonas thiooxydans]
MNRLPDERAQPYEVWEQKAKELIEREMENAGIGYKRLARLLTDLGINESAGQINRKVNRKRFSTAFFIACMLAMEVRQISLE